MPHLDGSPCFREPVFAILDALIAEGWGDTPQNEIEERKRDGRKPVRMSFQKSVRSTVGSRGVALCETCPEVISPEHRHCKSCAAKIRHQARSAA